MKKFFGALMLTFAFCGWAEASYEKGVEARKSGDYAEALNQWMVTSDDPRCMTAIGVMYDYGEGLPKDDEKAAEWYTRAADKGEYRAIAQLANFSLTGAGGVERNSKEWREKLEAIRGKDSYADYVLASFYMDGHGGGQDLVQAQELLSGLVTKGYAQLEASLRQVERRLADRRDGVLEAEALAEEMARGGASFDQKYKDRRVVLSGWINSVERLNDSGYVLKLGGEKTSSVLKENVLAVFYDAAKAGPPASLRRGAFVKLDGVYVGKHPFPLDDCSFTLFGCSLIESAAETPRP